MIILSQKFNCDFENIEGIRVDGKLNKEEKQESKALEYGNK
jgi:hypothetical protein